ncbi:breast cancer type 2 susceptibility protein [Halyomorpha halys]|uniref:breast cancer type 2 susceptibility protein n=1 Tax=Halyomorpha halys TaxID=286706 RepID=UPI0034D22C90
MDDSWQKLMGIDCDNEEGPSSPVFHKKKWIVLPTSLKRSGSGPLLTKCPEKKLENKKNDSNNSLEISEIKSTFPSGDKVVKNTTEEEVGPLLIYNTTPPKNYKQKRKTIDLLSCSLRREGSFCKKSKLDDKEHAKLSKDISGIKSEININEVGPETLMSTSVKVFSSESNEINLSQNTIASKPQRKLLYSCNEKSNSSLRTQTLTVNDIFKSVIMIDEADIHSSPKKNRQTSFEVGSNDFQSVTSLTKGKVKDCSNPVSPPSLNGLENCNDSFGNFMFTEIENECLTTKEVSLKSNCKTRPMPKDIPSTHDTNPMDETFSNYRFIEIEEDYSCLNHKGLKDDPVTSSMNLAVIGTGSSCSIPHNSSGRNICTTSDNKNDIPSNELVSHESVFLNRTVEAKSYHSLGNERNKGLVQENGLEGSYLESCDDGKDIFNSTVLSQKSIPELETATDNELFLSTSKECFDNLDAISTEEFRNKHLENHYNELNVSLKCDRLTQSIGNSEKDMLNNSSVSKLDITLTDIMHRLLKKRINDESMPNLKNHCLHKHITSNRNSSFDGLTEEETKNHEPYDQTLGNISLSECIPEPSGLLGTSETVFLTQEYLENIKPEDSVDSSVLYYQQSFDYMISAEVKSRLSGNYCDVPPAEQEPSLLNRSLSSEVCLVADSDKRSPDDNFINTSYRGTDFNESNTSNLNDTVNLFENTVKYPTDTDYFNKGSENKLSPCEHVSHKPVKNSSKELSDIQDLKESNNVEIQSDKLLSNINKFPNQTSYSTCVSNLNSDFISQGCLQQFNCSFRLEHEDLVSQKKEKNLDKSCIERVDVNNMNSNCTIFSTMDSKDINISKDCLRKDESKSINSLEETTLVTQKDTNQDNLRLNLTDSNVTTLNVHTNQFNSDNINLDVKTTEFKADVNRTLKSLPRSNKVDNFMFSSAGGKKIEVSENALTKVRSLFKEILETDRTEDTDTDDKIFNKQGPKSSFPSFNESDNFMFSSASGKNIKVSVDGLAKVKSKYNEMLDGSLIEVRTNETYINPISKSILTGSNKADNSIFSTTIGNHDGNVSDGALATIKSIEISENNVGKGGNDEIEINERQLLDTSFSCFDKSDPFSFSTDESKKIEISDVILDDMKSKFIGIIKDNSVDIELKKTKNVLSENRLSIKYKYNDSFPCSADFSDNFNADDKLIHRNTLENFPFTPKINSIGHENTPDKGARINFSTARGKHVRVSKDALLRVKSKFSEEIDNTPIHLFEAEISSDYIFQCTNSPNKSLSCDVCLDPVLKQTNSNKIEAQVPVLSIQESINPHTFTTVSMNKKLSINLNQNDKKSKSSHTGISTSDQPLAKKVCFNPGIVHLSQKLSNDVSEHNIPMESKMQHLTFTQSISQSILDEEMDIIENNKCPREILNLNDHKLNSNIDDRFETKDLESNKCDSQFSAEESDLTMIYEVSDSAAAFMANCTPDRSVLSSPSSFFNRKSMKPIKLLEMEFEDVDEEVLVAAELKVTPEQIVKNDSINLISNDFIGSRNFRSCPIEVLSIRADHRKRADEIIKQKLKNRPIASPGLYVNQRKNGSLKKISDNLQQFLDKKQLFQLGLIEEILCINSTNAGKFEFYAESFFSYEECFSKEGIIDLGYGFSLILSDDNKISLNELSRCFFLNPNVDPSLVSPAWIKNHFKWIVWKLASYERAFPKHLANRYLTPENVLHQLKYRYDREIDLAQRPALKKVLECDEPSSRRLIACVADIRNADLNDGESSYEIELTDSWYSIWACIDPAMKNLIDRQKVKIGMKLIIQAAELLNCTEGCDPLESTSLIRLKLHTNCVRRVKWDVKLGFTRQPGPIKVSLGSIFHNGGLVGLTSAVIARVYPLLFMSKDADGKTVLRNAYGEHHASCLKENDLTLKSEELFEKLYPEVELKYKSGVMKIDKNNITKIKEPEFLWKIVANESDPSEVQSLMTQGQLLEVRKYHELISSKIREEVQILVKKKLEELVPSQKSKCLLKLRLVDPISGCNAVLTVWNPSEDLIQILVEQKCFDFYTLIASGIRNKVLQLSSTNRTIYKENNALQPSEEFERKITSIYDIVVNSVSVQFGEIDVVGIVIFVKEPEKPWGVTNVYISDDQNSFLMITFWTSLKTFGCDDTLKSGSIVACINLQWRQGSGSYVIPSTYANEMTYFSTNPNQEYLIEAFQTIKSSVSTKGLENFIIERKRRLFTILKEREYNCKTPVSRVETPKVLKRLENLKKYGEASPLPKLPLLSSPDIHRKFRSPKSGGS